MRIMIRAMES